MVSYAHELDLIPAAISAGAASPLAGLIGLLEKSESRAVTFVGSGGSLPVASFLAELSRRYLNCDGKASTPLQLITDHHRGRKTIVLVSAGGSNADILAAFNEVQRRPHEQLGLITTSVRPTPLSQAVEQTGGLVFRVGSPSRGSFFAVSQTVTMFSAILSTVMPYCREIVGSVQKFEEAYSQAIRETSGISKSFWLSKSFLALHARAGEAAAIDFQTRMHEAGIGAVYREDLRNFCHGQYRWLETRLQDVSIMLFVGQEDQKVQSAFEACLPEAASISAFDQKEGFLFGSLKQICISMLALRYVAIENNVSLDNVMTPSWGRCLYEANGAY